MSLSDVRSFVVTTALAEPLEVKADKTALAAETSRAQGVEGALGGRLDAVETALPGKANAADLGSAAGANVEAFAPASAGISTAERTKLSGIATGATANDTDANLKNRANHTGSQPIASVTGLQDALDGTASSAQGAKADSAVQPDDLDARVSPVEALIPRAPERAGDARALFSTVTTGDPLGRAPVSVGSVVATAGYGAALRLAGADVDPVAGYVDIAPRIAVPIYPGRTCRLTYRIARAADPADPANNGVELRWQNLNQNKNNVSNVRLGDVLTPVVADGVLTYSFVIGKDGAPGDLDYVVPPSAVYGLPHIRVFGNGQQTDIIAVDAEDVTEMAAAQALVEANALSVDNITTTSGEKFSLTSNAQTTNGGATLITNAGAPVGFTIPAGQTGAGSSVIPRILFKEEEASLLAGSTLRFRTVMEVTAGYLAATPFENFGVRVERQDGSVTQNTGTVVSTTQDGTRIVRDVTYVMQGDERLVGTVLQVAPNTATGAVRSFEIVGVTWDAIAVPADKGSTGADMALDARLAALAPAVEIFDKLEAIFVLSGGAGAVLSDGGKPIGITLDAGETGLNTIMQWRMPMDGRLRAMLPGKQVRMTLGFDVTSGWNRAHSLNMQVRDVELALTNLVTANRVDKQVSPTRWKMSFTFLVPPATVLDDLRPYIAFTDTNAAAGAESIKLTDATISYYRSNSDVMGDTAATNLLGDEVARSSAVEQAVAQMTGSGKRVGALLSSASFASIAAALELATALGAPGAMAAVNIPAGTFSEHSLGLIGSGTDSENVIVRGAGMGRTKIVGYLPASTPVATIQATSTLDFNGETEIEGITATAQNMRYCGHIDSVKFRPNVRMVWRNCDLTHLGNAEADAYWSQNVWVSQHAYALGTTSGSYFGFFDCKGTAPRAAFSAHDQIDFTDPSTVEIVGGKWTATNTAGWSLRAESIGFGMMNRFIVRDATLSGDISMAVTPWLPTALDQQPADHRAWEMSGSGNSPAAFRVEDFGRALRITSATTGTASKVVISGTAAPILFGKTGTDGVTRVDGDVGMSGYAYGWADISMDTTSGRPGAITRLGVRLGNRTGSPLTLTVQVDALAPINITFDQNYPAMNNAAILAVINAALGSTATASEYAVGQRYRPSFTDEETSLQNSSGTMILMGMALAVDANGARTVRPMTADDPASAFAGVAWEDIRPGAFGRVKTAGWLPHTDLLRSDGSGPELHSFFRIDPAKPGYVLSNATAGILRVVRTSLGAGLWTVEVAPQQAIADYQGSVLPLTPGSAGTDPDGFADWYVDENGMIVSGERLQVGDLTLTNDYPGKLLVLDPDGFVMFDSDDVQADATPASDASVYAARDAANVAYAMTGQNDLMPIVQQIERGKVNIILTYGQSLRRSSRGYPPLTTTQPAYSDTHVYSFGQANRPADDDDTVYAPVTSAALYPLLAVSHYNNGTLISNAELETIGPDTAIPGESISISAAYWLRQQCLAKWGVEEDADTPFVVLDCAVGGQSISELSKGATPNLYNRIVSGLTQIRDLPAFAGKEFRLVLVDWGQGEEDYRDGPTGVDPDVASYTAAVEQLMDDIYADTLAIFNNGQKRPAVFIAQAGGAFTTDTTDLHVGQAQLNLVTQVDGYFPTGPSYPVVNVASAHPDNNGYRWLGQYCGRAWASVLVHGRHPNIVYPRSATWNAATNEVIIDFVSTGGPISEGHPYDGFTAQTVANLGISAKYGPTILPLSNVRLVGAMTVAATLQVTPYATNGLLYSQNLTNAVWQKTGATATAGRLTEDTSTGSHYVQQSYSYTSGVTYCLSVEASPVPGSGNRYLTLLLAASAFGANIYAKFDLSAGTVTYSSAGITAGMTNIGGSWRCWISATATVTAAASAQIRMYNTSGLSLANYTGDGASGFNLTNIQLEVGSKPTSPIVTTSSPASKATPPLIQIGTKALDNGYIGLRCASRMVAPESYTFIPDAGQDPAANVPALVGKPYNLDDWCWAASLQSEEI